MNDILIKNGKVLTMGAQGVIEGGQVLLKGGKIAAVGTAVECAGAQIIDAAGGWVLPGLIDPHCHIGIFETAIGFPGDDGNETSDPITPQIRGLDGINPMDPEYGIAVESGVTTVATGPGSANPLAGQFVAMKTWGKTMESMVVKAPLAMKAAFGENPKNVYGKANKAPVTRMATASLIREWLYKAKDYAEKKDAAGGDRNKLPAFDLKLEALEPVVRGEMVLKAHCHRADDIMTAIRIGKEFNLKMTLDHCTEGHLIAAEVAASGYPAILGPLGGFPHKPEVGSQSLEAAAILHRAGVKVGIMTDLPANHLWYLPLAVGMCVGAGLPEDEGFRTITQNAAEILGLAHRVGSLEPGKDADVAVFTQNPLRDLYARCALTVVDGVVRHRRDI